MAKKKATKTKPNRRRVYPPRLQAYAVTCDGKRLRLRRSDIIGGPSGVLAFEGEPITFNRKRGARLAIYRTIELQQEIARSMFPTWKHASLPLRHEDNYQIVPIYNHIELVDYVESES